MRRVAADAVRLAVVVHGLNLVGRVLRVTVLLAVEERRALAELAAGIGRLVGLGGPDAAKHRRREEGGDEELSHGDAPRVDGRGAVAAASPRFGTSHVRSFSFVT